MKETSRLAALTMAATRLPLLVLWLLAGTQTGEADFTLTEYIMYTPWISPPMPKDGSYIVSLRVEPNHGEVTRLSVTCWSNKTSKALYLFTAVGRKRIAHAEIAVPMNENDTLIVTKVEGTIQGLSMISYAYASHDTANFVTAYNRQPVQFAYILLLSQILRAGSWVANTQDSFTIVRSGIYWVTARADPDQFDTEVAVVKYHNHGLYNLLRVYAYKQTPVSCSGAFYLPQGWTVSLRVANMYSVAQRETMLSFLYLDGNKKPNTYDQDHIAFTAFYGQEEKHLQPRVEVNFTGVLTDYGNLTKANRIRITTSGSYMVSVRPMTKFNSTGTFSLFLMVNRGPAWVAFSEDGVPTGQTIALHLDAGDIIRVLTDSGGFVYGGSFFSIAFLQPH